MNKNISSILGWTVPLNLKRCWRPQSGITQRRASGVFSVTYSGQTSISTPWFVCMRVYACSPVVYQIGAAVGSCSHHMRSINRAWQRPGGLQESVPESLELDQAEKQPDRSLVYCIGCRRDPCHQAINWTPPVSRRPELLEQLWKTRAEKKKLRRTIKEFEDEFYQQNGR